MSRVGDYDKSGKIQFWGFNFFSGKKEEGNEHVENVHNCSNNIEEGLNMKVKDGQKKFLLIRLWALKNKLGVFT